MALDRAAIAGGALVQAVLLGVSRDGSQLSLAFVLGGLVGGAVAGALAPRDGQPWLDGFVAGAAGLGLYLLWVAALGVQASLAVTGNVLSTGSFITISIAAAVALLVGPFHAVGGLVAAAVVDTARRRLARRTG